MYLWIAIQDVNMVKGKDENVRLKGSSTIDVLRSIYIGDVWCKLYSD